MEPYFNGKTAVVTGGASGIGAGIARALLEMGAVVYIADLKQENLDRTCEELKEFAPRLHAVKVDVTQQPQVQALVETAAREQGSLDFMFNNAGVGMTVPIERASLESWKFVMDLNLWGSLYGMLAALPVMREQGHGHIVNTASIAGLLPIPFQAPYCATKAAIISASESLRYELIDENIRFTCVCPSNVATAIFASLGKIPEDAVTVDEAVKTILEGVAANKNIIVLPEKTEKQYENFRLDPEAQDEYMINLSRERHENYRTKGTYF
ncbi:MAG: SDR family oxidoreductase [Synergistaceae bacterium]|nr:SDR family oxidoreductase [Synergistaceae bacterium]